MLLVLHGFREKSSDLVPPCGLVWGYVPVWRGVEIGTWAAAAKYKKREAICPPI